jgi:hypothetical protein
MVDQHDAEEARLKGAPQQRAAWMFRRATLRDPSPQDVTDLVTVYQTQLQAYVKDPESAKKVIAVGDLPPEASIPPPELAAWTLVGNVLLNLDEFVSKR